MMNLSYAPIALDEMVEQLPNESHLSLKIIELIKISNDLEKDANPHRVSEELELTIL